MGEGVYVLLEMGGERSGGLICWGSWRRGGGGGFTRPYPLSGVEDLWRPSVGMMRWVDGFGG